MIPTRFCSSHIHNQLYKAYDSDPWVWKPSMYSFKLSDYFNWGVNNPDKIKEFSDRLLERIQEARVPFDFQGCDYWCERRGPMAKSVLGSKNASCQWMSFVNY